MSITYRAIVHRGGVGWGVPDPETYWGDLVETVELLDAVLSTDEHGRSGPPITMIEVTPFEQLELWPLRSSSLDR